MRTQFYLAGIPLVLRDALEARAREQETSVSNVIGGVLADRYGIEFTPSTRTIDKRFRADEYVRPNGQAIGITMNLSLPSTVVEAVREQAAEMYLTQRYIVLHSLAAALNVELPKPRNRGHGRPRGRMVKT